MAGPQGLRLPFHAASNAPCQISANQLENDYTRWRHMNDTVCINGNLAGRPSELHASAIAAQPMEWSNMRGMLTYRSFTCDMQFRWGDEVYSGVGLLEHAWGGHLPLPVGRLIPGSWQWDVLWEKDAPERTIYACLSSKLAGSVGYAPRIFADRAGNVQELGGSAVEIGAYQDGAPTFWHGILGTEVYRAERVGKALFPFPRGAFFGSQYDLNGRRGIGFSERITSPYRPIIPKPQVLPALHPAS